MSNFYNQASWVLVPSGIEEDIVFAQKPTSGLGDLTMTRASDATYTDAGGVVRRSPYNLTRFSEMFTDASWGKNALGINTAIGTSGIQANVANAPNGTLTADRVNFNLQSDLDLGLNQTISEGFAGQSFVGSVYVKGEGSNIGKQIKLRLKRNTGGSFVGVDTTITLTSDWVRITPSALTLVSGNTGLQYIISSNDATNALIWGTQVVEGTSALDYFPTTNRQDVPRIDFRNADGTLSSCGRLLLEPQRTNSIRNSSMVGAVAGSPGTFPTNWLAGSAGGLTRSIAAVGTENGLPYVDIRFQGTATSVDSIYFFESATSIAASTAQSWTLNFSAKVVSGTAPTCGMYIVERAAAGVFVAEGVATRTFTSALNRYNFTRTLSGGATVVATQPGFLMNLVVSTAYDFTIRIAAPQMELGAYATTWVPTTTAAVTRLADTASKSGVSSLIGQTEGTLFVDVTLTSRADFSYFAIAPNLSSAQSFIGISTTSTIIAFVVYNSGVVQVSYGFPNSSIGNFKIAFAYKTNDFVAYLNGTQVHSDTSGTVPACSQIGLNAFNNAASLNYNQAALFPVRLDNTTLAALTTL